MTELAQIKSLSRYFQHSARFYFVLTDLSGIGIYANPLFLDECQPAFPSIAGVSFAMLIPEGDLSRYRQALKQAVQQPLHPVSVDLHHEFSAGYFSLIRWEFQAYPDTGDDPGYLQCLGVPVKMLKEQESIPVDNKISEQERYQAYEMSAQAMWRMEMEEPASIKWPADQLIQHWRRYGYIAECNDNMAIMYGFKQSGDMVGLRIENVMDLDNPKQQEFLRQFINNGFSIHAAESEGHDINGRRLHFVNNMTGIIEDNQLKRVWGTQQDITEQKKAEEDRLRNELFYRNLIADALDGILLTDINGIISFASPSVERILGYRSEELLQTHAFDYVHPDDYKEAIAAFENEVKMEPVIKYIDIRLKTKSGEWLYCNVRGHNMLYNPYVGRMAVYFHDDSRRKAAEDQLKVSQQQLRGIHKKEK